MSELMLSEAQTRQIQKVLEVFDSVVGSIRQIPSPAPAPIPTSPSRPVVRAYQQNVH